jgi:putative membrane protein
MLAVHPVQETVRALPALIAVLFAGSSSGHGSLWGLVGVTVTVGLGVLRWATTSYRVSVDQVQVRRGFFRRRVLSIPRDRVRTVDITAHAMHRLLGLTRLAIGTGQSDRKQNLQLDGLTAPDAAWLRAELLHRAPATDAAAGPGPAHAPVPVTAAPVQTETVLLAVRPGWVRYAPFTLSGVATIGIAAGFFWRIVNDAHVNPERFGPLHEVTNQLGRAPLGLAIAEVVVAALAVVAVTSAVGYLLAFWSFRLTRQSPPPADSPGGVGPAWTHATATGTLHITRGLITTRATTIEERRLRGVELSEPLLLRAVRAARCIAISTGLRVGRGSERGGSLLMPPGPLGEAYRVAGAVLGGTEPVTGPLRQHGPRARRRRYTRALAGCTLPPVALLLLWGLAGWPAWPWQVALVLLPLGALMAEDRYRSLGHEVIDGYLVVRRGSLVRRRVALERDGIIGWHLRRSFFQRRSGLVTVTATTAAGRQRYELPDVRLDESAGLVDRATPDLLTPFLA